MLFDTWAFCFGEVCGIFSSWCCLGWGRVGNGDGAWVSRPLGLTCDRDTASG